MRRTTKAAVVAAAVGLVGALTSPLFAANPSSGTVAVPANPGGTASASWTGTIPVAPPNVTGQCSDDTFADAFAVTFTLPSGFYDTRSANFKFSITWTPTNAQADAAYNDEVITVLAPDGTVVARNDGAETTETAVAANLKAGTYKVLACGSINTSDQPYKGSLTVTTTSAASAAKPPRNPNSANDNLLQFTAATVVDPLVFGGEPGLNFDATTDGSRAFVDWPVSSRTNIGVLFRSDDGGLTFRKRYADAGDPSNAGLVCAGRQVPMCTTGGGGDTDVNVNEGNGNVYFASQESLGAQAVASSFDHGVSFDTNHTDPVVSAPCAPVDRQWLASYKGTNDVFLAFHVPVVAECISHSTTGGTTGTWQPPAIGFQNVTQSGALVIDNTGGPHNHTLYVSYIAHVLNGLDDLGTFHVAVSTDDGANWTDHRIPNTASVRSMNKLQIDSAGNLYITWAESNTEHTWLSTSLAADPANAAAPASKWSTPVIVDGDPLTVTIFPDVVAGSPGKIAVSYYGTAADAIDPDHVLTGQGGWYPFVSTSYNALCQWDATPCKSPSFHQSVIAHQANHDDNICTSGTACVAQPSPAKPGNRNLLDYFDVSLDRQGHLGFVWSDTRNATGLPFVKVARQATGPSLFDGKPGVLLGKRVNGVGDPAGDALYPIAGKKLLTASNQQGLDLLGTTIEIKDAKTATVRMRVADSSKVGAIPTGMDDLSQLQQAKYITRWDFGGNAWYVGANVPAGSTTPTFFSGKVSNDEGMLSPASGGVMGNTYQPLTAATGKVEDGAIVIDVPLEAIGSPTVNSPLYSVGSYALIGPQDQMVTLNTAPITVDATPTFDVALAGPGAQDILKGGNGPGGTPGAAGGSGTLPATGDLGDWALIGLGLGMLGLGLTAGRRRLAGARREG